MIRQPQRPRVGNRDSLDGWEELHCDNRTEVHRLNGRAAVASWSHRELRGYSSQTDSRARFNSRRLQYHSLRRLAAGGGKLVQVCRRDKLPRKQGFSAGRVDQIDR